MNRTTKPKIIGISALLIAALLIGVVFASAVSGDSPKDRSRTISDGIINDTELSRNDLQDLYRRYNVTENDVLFATNELPHYLERKVLDNDTIVIATETGEPPEDLKEGEDCEIAISTENLCMIWAQGKNLSTENLMQHRDILADAFFKRFGEKIPHRYVGMSEDLKVSKDSKLVAYGFRILPNGILKEYRGYCDQDFSGYKEAMNKTDSWFSTLDEETSDREVLLSTQQWSLINMYIDDYTHPPYGDYSTKTEWYWDDVETDNDNDYFMLKSRFSMMPGCQQYGNYWCNYRGHMHHDWKYYSYPGTRDMSDAQPYDRSGETTVDITLSGGMVSPTWSTIIPDYSLDDQSDYIQGVAKWEEKINYYSSTCGGSTLTVNPGSDMHCSQDEVRSGSWIGLAYFESKPKWFNTDPWHFGGTYTPGYQGYSNSVRWTGSGYEG